MKNLLKILLLFVVLISLAYAIESKSELNKVMESDKIELKSKLDRLNSMERDYYLNLINKAQTAEDLIKIRNSIDSELNYYEDY